MPSSEEMRETMCSYLERVGRGDVEGVIALFSEDVSVEDPVGGPPGTHVTGREAVARFFTKGFARSRPHPSRTGPICATAADTAAMPFVLELDMRGERVELDVIDVVTFDTQGRITSLRAFWSPAEARPARTHEPTKSR